MLFTRQRSSTGQQVLKACSYTWLTPYPESVKNWSPVSICSSVVGSHNWQYWVPGFTGQDSYCGSNSSERTPAQLHVYMKNARKATGAPVSDKLRATGPEAPSVFENQVFATPPAPRQPESPDVESLRSLLKANLPREKASPALLQRIRSRMQEDKV